MTKKIGLIFVFAVTLLLAHTYQAHALLANTTAQPITSVDIKAGPSVQDGPITVPAGGVYVAWQSFNNGQMVNTYGNTPCVGTASPSRGDFSGNYVSSGDIIFNQTVSTAYTITCGSVSDTVVVNIQGQPPFSGAIPQTTTTSSATAATSADTSLMPSIATVGIVAGPGPYPSGIGPYHSSISAVAGSGSYLGWSSYDASNAAVTTYAPTEPCTGSASPSDTHFAGSYVATGNIFVSPTVSTTYTIKCGSISDSVKINVSGTAIPNPVTTTPLTSIPATNPITAVTPIPLSCTNLSVDVQIGDGGNTGANGTTVLALQNFLVAKGYLSVASATGYFGVTTQSAVIAYQNAQGISPAAGYVGALTRAAIAAVSGCAPTFSSSTSTTVSTGVSTSTASPVTVSLQAVGSPLQANADGTLNFTNQFQEFDLNWSTTGTHCSLTLSPDPLYTDQVPRHYDSEVGPSGSIPVYLSALSPTTNPLTYTMTCTNPAGQSGADSVTVIPTFPGSTYTATPATPSAPNTSTGVNPGLTTVTCTTNCEVILAPTSVSTVPGCAPGANFSSTTAAPCNPSSSSSVPGCMPGAKFSSTTAAPCNSSSSSSSGSTSSTSGGPTVNLQVNSADSVTIVPGAQAFLAWQAQPSTSSTLNCTGSGGAGIWPGGKPLTGVASFNPTSQTTYTITCTDSSTGKSASDSVTVMMQGAATNNSSANTSNTASTASNQNTSTVSTSMNTANTAAAGYITPFFEIYAADGITPAQTLTLASGQTLLLPWGMYGQNTWTCNVNPGGATGSGTGVLQIVSNNSAYPSESGTIYTLSCRNTATGQTSTDSIKVTTTNNNIVTTTQAVNGPAGVADLKASTDGVNFSDGPVTLNNGDTLWFKWTSTNPGNVCNVQNPLTAQSAGITYLGSGFASFTFSVTRGNPGYPYSAGAQSIQYSLTCNNGVYNGQTFVDDAVTINFAGQNLGLATQSASGSSNSTTVNTSGLPQGCTTLNVVSTNTSRPCSEYLTLEANGINSTQTTISPTQNLVLDWPLYAEDLPSGAACSLTKPFNFTSSSGPFLSGSWMTPGAGHLIIAPGSQLYPSQSGTTYEVDCFNGSSLIGSGVVTVSAKASTQTASVITAIQNLIDALKQSI